MSPEEADWQLVSKKLKPLALDRLCARILLEVSNAASQPDKTNHERYLDVYRIVTDRDRDVASAFNDLRRSTLWQHLVEMDQLGLFTDEERKGLSEPVQRSLAEFRRPQRR